MNRETECGIGIIFESQDRKSAESTDHFGPETILALTMLSAVLVGIYRFYREMVTEPCLREIYREVTLKTSNRLVGKHPA